jgi:hypothetical protein
MMQTKKTINNYIWEQVQEVNQIKEKIDFTPEYGVILGSGLEFYR